MFSSDNNFLIFINFIVVAFISIIRIISIIVNEIWFSFAERNEIYLTPLTDSYNGKAINCTTSL